MQSCMAGMDLNNSTAMQPATRSASQYPMTCRWIVSIMQEKTLTNGQEFTVLAHKRRGC